MNKLTKLLTLVPLMFLFYQCSSGNSIEVSSPDGAITVTFTLNQGGPTYQVRRSGQDVIQASKLGFIFKDAAPLNRDLIMTGSRRSRFDQTWVQPWGEVKEIRNHYNELRIQLEETGDAPRKMNLVFRVYDDGLGFRYELPKQEHLNDFQIMDEVTEFAMAGDHRTWWIPAFQRERYEYLYRNTVISAIPDSVRAVHTPLTMETQDGLFLSIHEANLTDYASMTLAKSDNDKLLCNLVPWSDGVKVKASTPHHTPWRTVQIAENAGDLIESYLILNLNEPNKLGDVSWVKPTKYVGIWWGMHINKYTWESGEKHGATTANTKQYIDFAAKYGFPGVLVEGWNVGWDGNWIENSDLFSFTEPYDDFDIEELSAYAASKGVKIIGHHETSTGIDNYERQVDAAFDFCNKYGIEAVKTGYVGFGQGIERRDENGAIQKEWHHGQYMVRHYRSVVEKAAEHKIMLDVHEPIKDTGIRRTYPNMMTREGARGQEYNAWSGDGGNPPDHTTILPFTRLLAGPMDFTPGIFDLLFEKYKSTNRVNTTLAKQLALYVVLFSPLHMAADLPENYQGQPAFQFIVDVPVDWQETQVLHAQIGDYVVVARKDRNSDDWYLGGITDQQSRSLETQLSFLDAGRKYVAEIYADAADADWETNPLAINISQALVDRTTLLDLELAAGGGQAVRIRPATEEETNRIPPY